MDNREIVKYLKRLDKFYQSFRRIEDIPIVVVDIWVEENLMFNHTEFSKFLQQLADYSAYLAEVKVEKENEKGGLK